MDITPFTSLEQALTYIKFINSLRENKINMRTYEKVKIAKNFIEKKYRMKHILEAEQIHCMKFLIKDWEKLNRKLDELNIPVKRADEIKKSILHKMAEDSKHK